MNPTWQFCPPVYGSINSHVYNKYIGSVRPLLHRTTKGSLVKIPNTLHWDDAFGGRFSKTQGVTSCFGFGGYFLYPHSLIVSLPPKSSTPDPLSLYLLLLLFLVRSRASWSLMRHGCGISQGQWLLLVLAVAVAGSSFAVQSIVWSIFRRWVIQLFVIELSPCFLK